MSSFEVAQELAKTLAETFVWRGYKPTATLSVLEVTNENHVPIYTNGPAREVWSVGCLKFETDDPYLLPSKIVSEVYVAADGTLFYFWPFTTGFEHSGWEPQRVDVFALRRLSELRLSEDQLRDLYDQLNSV